MRIATVLLTVLGLYGSLQAKNNTPPPPSTYVTSWLFVETEVPTQGPAVMRYYNNGLDQTAEVQMPLGHSWACERMEVMENDEETLEQGSFICTDGNAMFTLTSVCTIDKPDANQSTSVLIQTDKPKVVLTVVCKTVRAGSSSKSASSGVNL